MSATKELTAVEREAVNAYLAKLAALFGIPNLLFLAGAFVYVLYFVPQQAAIYAVDLVTKQTAEVTNTVLTSSAKALAQLGRAEADFDQSSKRVAQLATELANLERSVAAFKASDTASTGELIMTVKANPDAEKVIRAVGRISALEDRFKDHKLKVGDTCFRPVKFSLCTNGTDAASWFWGSAICPPGYRLTGEGTTTALMSVACE